MIYLEKLSLNSMNLGDTIKQFRKITYLIMSTDLVVYLPLLSLYYLIYIKSQRKMSLVQ